MDLKPWLSPDCPPERPPLDAMSPETRGLHAAIDAHARREGEPFLHPDCPTVQLDLLGSSSMIAWQEAKEAAFFTGDGSWSELPQVYARYGTGTTRRLLAEVRRMEAARGAIVTDSGMQATALVVDAVLQPGGHAICHRQVYNKTRKYIEWTCQRIGAALSIVDDLREPPLRPETQLVFCESLTNPLLEVQDLEDLRRIQGPTVVVDTTISTPWSARLLEVADVVVASGTKALGGQDTDLWGYAASDDLGLVNRLMDLLALRGGILDWRRAEAILAGLEVAEDNHRRRCESALEVVRFLVEHPQVAEVFHPSLRAHGDYELLGSLLSFRLVGADEEATRHFCDALATCVVPRYALSFDGLVSKVNHHTTVSEYFTPPPVLPRAGCDRLVRIGVGLESPRDLCAALNWALLHGRSLPEEELEAWRERRRAALSPPPVAPG